MLTVGWDKGDRGWAPGEREDACPAPEGPTSRHSPMWAALLSLEALHKANKFGDLKTNRTTSNS